MTSLVKLRLTMLTRVLALAIVVLVVSPVTAPFAAFDLTADVSSATDLEASAKVAPKEVASTAAMGVARFVSVVLIPTVIGELCSDDSLLVSSDSHIILRI